TARNDVVILSERLWRNRFGADPAILGRTLTLDERPYTVIGILPAGFQFMNDSDLWTLFVPQRGPEQRRMHYLRVIGRMKPEVTVDAARADMNLIARQIAE